MSPQDWPLPSAQVARQCLGTEYSAERSIEDFLPIGSVFSDIGCDRILFLRYQERLNGTI